MEGGGYIGSSEVVGCVGGRRLPGSRAVKPVLSRRLQVCRTGMRDWRVYMGKMTDG